MAHMYGFYVAMNKVSTQ